MSQVRIIDESPHADGVQTGRDLGGEALRQRTRAWLDDPLLRDDLGAMSEAALEGLAHGRLLTPPNDAARPELDVLHPERLAYLRGLAEGAGCSLAQAAGYDYVGYLHDIRRESAVFHPPPAGGNCSGILFVGPEGVIAGQNIDSLPHPPRPEGYRHRRPGPYRGMWTRRKLQPSALVLRRPASGYIADWGTTNEHGLGLVGGGSCGVWLDEPVVDVWPIKHVPLLRFARTVRELETLYHRYRLFNWGRSSEIWADLSGDAIVVEHAHQRIGIRRIERGAVWSTEGHFQSDEMAAYLRERRLTYVRGRGLHLGVGDLQYATDCAVRFTHLGELAHQDLGRGREHMRRLLADHAPFPRAVCRHGGPDTDAYDLTVTLRSTLFDLTANRIHVRAWQPWKRFPCQVAERVTQFPPRPCDA